VVVVVVGLLIHVKGRDGESIDTSESFFPFSYLDVARVLLGVGEFDVVSRFDCWAHYYYYTGAL
jgi:hypothetical protein